jgi:hypothetical protein
MDADPECYPHAPRSLGSNTQTLTALNASVFGAGDFCNPARENGLLCGLGIRETHAHSHTWVNVNNFSRGFEETIVAANFDDDVGAVRKRTDGIEIAASDAQIGGAQLDLGAGADLSDSGFGDERIARIATAVAPTPSWRFTFQKSPRTRYGVSSSLPAEFSSLPDPARPQP